MGDACEGGTERGQLRPPDRLDETTELVYDLQPSGSAVFILVFPAEQAHRPFLQHATMCIRTERNMRSERATDNDLVRVIEVSAGLAGRLDIQNKEGVVCLYRSSGIY